MTERYPIHIMIKPEGLENFPGFIRCELQLFEEITGAEITTRVVTRLTPEQARLIYPESSFPPEVRRAIASGKTEHYIFHGASDIYEMARKTKGKANIDWGIRGKLARRVEGAGLRFERWQNFIHTSDTLEETRAICSHFNSDLPVCTGCVANGLCYVNLEDSTVPNTSLEP